MTKCVFAGTFDPPTLGHQETIEQCLALFDRVVVAVMVTSFAVMVCPAHFWLPV